MIESDLIDQWLTECYIDKGASPGTVALRRYQMGRLVRWLGDRSLWDLTTDDLTQFVLESGHAANTRIVMRSGVISLYRWARKRGHISGAPAEDIPKPRSPQPRPRPVPNDVYKRVLAAAPDLRLRVALRLAGELGLRRAEASGLRRDHLVLDEDGYWLRFVGKGDKERMIPCPDDIAADILTLIDSTPYDWAFPSRNAQPTGYRGHGEPSITWHDKPISPHSLGSLVSGVLPDGYTMHKLRHRAGTEAYRRSGNDIYLASKLLGHSSVTTTQAYVKPDMSRLRSVLSRGEA